MTNLEILKKSDFDFFTEVLSDEYPTREIPPEEVKNWNSGGSLVFSDGSKTTEWKILKVIYRFKEKQ